jgi:hypothetical protein
MNWCRWFGHKWSGWAESKFTVYTHIRHCSRCDISQRDYRSRVKIGEAIRIEKRAPWVSTSDYDSLSR